VSRGLFAAVFLPLGLILAVVAIFSLQWRMVHDSAIMLYVAFLIDRFGRVPYRDIFDINTPGVHAANLLIGKIFGWSDAGARWADLVCLGGILASTWAFMRGFGGRVATAAAITFGLAYLNGGTYLSLQRDYLLLLPISAALAALVLIPAKREGLRAFVVSLLFGAAATIKPHSALGYPLLVLYLIADDRTPVGGKAAPGSVEVGAPARRDRRTGFIAASAGLGFALPVAGAFLYLAMSGALPAFLDIVSHYWPYYPTIGGNHGTMEGIDRLVYLAVGFARFGSFPLWLLPAALGLTLALFHSRLDPTRRRLALLLAGLAAVYAFYPVLSGKFWPYHYVPFLYFAVLLGATCLVDSAPEVGKSQRALNASALILAVVCQGCPPGEFVSQITAAHVDDPLVQRVDVIAGYLKEHLRPGDKVQPLDWTGGAAQAMLKAGADLATSFYDDFHFYHHVSDPYIQGLRRRFISELQAAPPRFIIEIDSDKPWVWGPGTTREFPELQRFLLASYRPAFEGEGYVILERR
jgi:hypothetical protein